MTHVWPSSVPCLTSNLYTVWKADHIAILLADTAAKIQRLNLVVSDSHIGIMPYFSF
jgi:hypothetical protein